MHTHTHTHSQLHIYEYLSSDVMFQLTTHLFHIFLQHCKHIICTKRMAGQTRMSQELSSASDGSSPSAGGQKAERESTWTEVISGDLR